MRVTVLVTGLGYLGSRLIREVTDHPAFSDEKIRILDDFRQPRFHLSFEAEAPSSRSERVGRRGADNPDIGRVVGRPANPTGSTILAAYEG